MTTDGYVYRDSEKRRMTIAVPRRTALFVEAVHRLLPRGKKRDLHQAIMAAGVAALFGITCEELDQCEITLPPSGAAIPEDLKELTNLLCGE